MIINRDDREREERRGVEWREATGGEGKGKEREVSQWDELVFGWIPSQSGSWEEIGINS